MTPSTRIVIVCYLEKLLLYSYMFTIHSDNIYKDKCYQERFNFSPLFLRTSYMGEMKCDLYTNFPLPKLPQYPFHNFMSFLITHKV